MERWQRLVIAVSVAIYTLYTAGFLFVVSKEPSRAALALLTMRRLSSNAGTRLYSFFVN